MYQLLSGMTEPLTAALLLTCLLATWQNVRPVTKRIQLTLLLVIVGTYITSTPLFAHFAVGTLEWPFRRPPNNEKQIDAIVVLAGNVFPADAGNDRDSLGSGTVMRCIAGADLYGQIKCRPVILSGGRIAGCESSAAKLMQQFIIRLGVRDADTTIEETSQSTYENAKHVAKILHAQKFTRIAVVTTATHLRRSVRCFESFGFTVIPVGCEFRANRLESGLSAVLPTASSAKRTGEVAHEWVGYVWYLVTGRFRTVMRSDLERFAN